MLNFGSVGAWDNVRTGGKGIRYALPPPANEDLDPKNDGFPVGISFVHCTLGETERVRLQCSSLATNCIPRKASRTF